MKKNSKISYNELAEKLGINPSAVQKNIRKLKKSGIIKRVGKKRGGHWKVIGQG
jgi:ATP-dependent DNA helicase RecG